MLPITIRWDSALPVRLAARQLGNQAPFFSEEQAQKSYILTVTGLIPAGRYRGTGQLPSQSHSDGATVDPQDPEQMLEGLMSQSRLMPRGEKPIAPEDVKLDAATGALHFFFPRKQELDLKTKDITFAARFGSMTVQKQFRLKDLVYRGKLEL